MRRLRIFLIVLIVLLVLLGVAYEVGRRYLGSRRVADEVARRLQAAYGGHVEVGDVDIGMGGSSAHHVRLFEEKQGRPARVPWADIGDVETDVSLWDLLRGDANPQRLTFRDANVTLRFDEKGRLLTDLPRPKDTSATLPVIRVAGSRLVLQQAGRPEVVVSGIDGQLEPDGSRVRLSGKVTDPHWGDWTLTAEANRLSREAHATLKTVHPVHVTQEMLNSLPFIAPAVWKEVQAEGDTPVEFTLATRPKEKGVHYRVVLEPQNTAVRVTAIDLRGEHAAGGLVVDDGVVTLRQVHGQAFGGRVATDGVLDFISRPQKLDFKARVNDLVVTDLPKSWGLGEQIEGRLTGTANLVVTISDGGVHTSGTGKGVIDHARVGGQPADPITIELRQRPEGRGFRLSAEAPTPTGDPRVQLPRSREPAAVEAATAPPADTHPDTGPPVTFTAFKPAPTPAEVLTPSWFINRSVDLLQEGLRTVTDAGTKFLRPAPKVQGGPAPAPRYLDINLAMHDVNLEQFARGLKIHLPFRLTGKASFRVRAALPLDTPRDPKTYRAEGTATVAWIDLAGLEMRRIEARVRYADGLLRLEQLQGQVPTEARAAAAGSFRGDARAQLFPRGDLTAAVRLDRVPLVRLLSLVPDAAAGTAGDLTGSATFRAPVAHLQDRTTWQADGRLTAPHARVAGLDLANARADLRLAKGELTVANGQALLEQTPVDLAGGLRLTAPYAYHGKLNLTRTDLAALQRLNPKLRPPVPVAGRLSASADAEGTLQPLTVQTAGTASAADLTIDRVTVQRLRLRWGTKDDRVLLSDVRGDLYKGRLTGSAAVPLRNNAAGSVDVRFKGVDVGSLASSVPAMPVTLQGQADGTIQGTMPPARPGQARVFDARIDLRAPQLVVQGIPAQGLHGKASYRDRQLDYSLQGESLGGTFTLSGTLPSAPRKPAAPARQSRLTIEGVQLARLWDAMGVTRVLGPLRGRFDLTLPFDYDPAAGGFTGDGEATLRGLRWGETQLATTLRSPVQLRPEVLRLADLGGTVGQGQLRGRIALNLRDFDRSGFNITLDQAESSRLFAPWPGLGSRIEGPVTVGLRGRFGRVWSGTGSVALPHGRLLGVDVAQWRLPLTWTVAPAAGRGAVTIPDSPLQFARGRATARAEVQWGEGARVDGHIDLLGLDLGTLSRQLSGSSQAGSGQMSGTLNFSGNEVRSIDDVSATLSGRLSQTQAFQFPVLNQIAPYVLGGASASATAQTGRVRARLDRGLIRIQELSLQGKQFPVYVTGTATLAGRIDLDVTVRAGRRLRAVGLLALPAGPLPVAFLTLASNTLARQLVHVRATGTARNPVVQVLPPPILSEGAARLFLGQPGG
jgi:hypothetical protein